MVLVFRVQLWVFYYRTGSFGYNNILNVIRDLFTSKKPFKIRRFVGVLPGGAAGHHPMPGGS
jgi:hypothetical protein